MIGLSGVCMVGDRVQVLALPCSTPLGCEGSTPLSYWSGHGAPWGWEEDRQLALCPCGACSLAVPLPGTLSFIHKGCAKPGTTGLHIACKPVVGVSLFCDTTVTLVPKSCKCDSPLVAAGV
jgi:hypothetical protein